jgi:N-acetylmuramoyl-L-alanine amidase
MQRQRTDFIVIHCSATPASMDIGAKEIDRWHRAKGWFKIGYHFVIRRDGTIEHGRELNEIGAHAYGVNDRSIGICVVGGVAKDGKTTEENYTASQWVTLEKLVTELEEQFPQAKTVGHRDVTPGRDCPCFDVATWNRNRTQNSPEAIEKAAAQRPLVYSVLREGAKGPLVKTLQAKLNRFSKIDVDGVFGPQTRRAVESFQQHHKLMDDGIVGPKTWTTLLRYD